MGVRAQRGFTLIELMVVVVIVAILAAIGLPAYHRYVIRSRKTEVAVVFGEVRVKQEAYRGEFGAYLALGDDGHPALSDDAALEPVGKPWRTDLPASWTTLALSPKPSDLYCSYAGQVGAGGEAPVAGSVSAGIFGEGVTPTIAWWTAWADCNWDSDATTDNRHETASDRTTIFEENDLK